MRLRVLILLMDRLGYDYEVVKGPPAVGLTAGYFRSLYEPRAAFIRRELLPRHREMLPERMRD